MYPIRKRYQQTSIAPITRLTFVLNQHTLLTHSINTPYQYTLLTHLISPHEHTAGGSRGSMGERGGSGWENAQGTGLQIGTLNYPLTSYDQPLPILRILHDPFRYSNYSHIFLLTKMLAYQIKILSACLSDCLPYLSFIHMDVCYFYGSTR